MHWHLKHWWLGLASDATAVYYDCLVAVQTTIRALGLTGVASASIVVKKLPLDRVKKNDALSYPIVLITPVREQISPTEGSNLQDDYVYSVLVTILDDDNQEKTLAANLPAYLLWRQQIEHAFQRQRLASLTTVYTATVEPADAVSLPAWARNLYMTALLLRFYSRETR